MAKKIVHQLIDDIDGTVLSAGNGETVRFSLDGTSYEIDLSSEHAAKLRAAFAPYIKAGRRAAGSGGTRGAKRASRSPEAARIRAWAADHGYTVSERGRVPAPIVEAYHAARG